MTERWTIDDLVAKDKLVSEKKSLKGLIEEMEDEVLANAGVDVFEEVFKLIFTKLDETTTLGNLLNLRLYTNADMSYVTYGQNVPDDIEEFNPQSTVKQLLGGKN